MSDVFTEIGTLLHGSTPVSASGVPASGSFNLFDTIFGKPTVSTDVSISDNSKTFVYIVIGLVACLVFFGKKRR